MSSPEVSGSEKHQQQNVNSPVMINLEYVTRPTLETIIRFSQPEEPSSLFMSPTSMDEETHSHGYFHPTSSLVLPFILSLSAVEQK